MTAASTLDHVVTANVTTEMKSREMCINDLAAVVGKSAKRVTAYLEGRKSWPFSHLVSLAEAFGVNVSDLLRDEVGVAR
ncbi:hypothetical protein B7R22_05460 [Subtercola boreus]|uniref:HTH cro/C1-type domain-containing protein n=1 Tax=Subtercola boreus TaxID=120213 RepID=A0A3E0W210_9MICO|nr:helix-turn-helix transcriptional regulator [Subtercola boreus]RFA15855.1 hypothetical protein B7R22_05460 [Subtercola boreus]